MGALLCDGAVLGEGAGGVSVVGGVDGYGDAFEFGHGRGGEGVGGGEMWW